VATHSIKTTNMGQGGFKKEPVRGDGYSLRKASEILKNDRRFRGTAPENEASRLKEEDLKRWDANHTEPVTKDGLLSRLGDASLQEQSLPYGGAKLLFFSRGLWSLTLVDQGSGALDFSIQVLVENRRMVSPSLIRRRIVSQLGEEVYEDWKQMVLSDEESLRVCMEAGCEWLKTKKNRAACSYISSPSSHRLIQRLGLRTERGWCFLFPHYAGSF